MSKRMKSMLAVAAVVLLAAAGFAFYVYESKSYYPPLPMGGVAKKDVLRAIRGGEGLTPVHEDDQAEWFGFRGHQGGGGKRLIEAMARRGWTFDGQEGAGYMFRDADGGRRIVESEMWTSRYVLYQVFK